MCFLSDINVLCRLVHRVNLTHSAHTRGGLAAGSDKRELSYKITASYYGTPPGVARKLVSAMLGFGKTRGHIPPQTLAVFYQCHSRELPMQALRYRSWDLLSTRRRALRPFPRASVAPHIVARHTMRPFARSGASVKRYKKSR